MSMSNVSAARSQLVTVKDRHTSKREDPDSSQVELLEPVSMVVPGKWLPCSSGGPARTELLCGNLHETADVAPHKRYASQAIGKHILHAHDNLSCRPKGRAPCTVWLPKDSAVTVKSCMRLNIVDIVHGQGHCCNCKCGKVQVTVTYPNAPLQIIPAAFCVARPVCTICASPQES